MTIGDTVSVCGNTLTGNALFYATNLEPLSVFFTAVPRDFGDERHQRILDAIRGIYDEYRIEKTK